MTTDRKTGRGRPEDWTRDRLLDLAYARFRSGDLQPLPDGSWGAICRQLGGTQAGGPAESTLKRKFESPQDFWRTLAERQRTDVRLGRAVIAILDPGIGRITELLRKGCDPSVSVKGRLGALTEAERLLGVPPELTGELEAEATRWAQESFMADMQAESELLARAEQDARFDELRSDHLRALQVDAQRTGHALLREAVGLLGSGVQGEDPQIAALAHRVGPDPSRGGHDVRGLVAQVRMLARRTSDLRDFAASLPGAPLRVALWLAAGQWADRGLLDPAVAAGTAALQRRPDAWLVAAMLGAPVEPDNEWLETHWWDTSQSRLVASTGRRVTVALLAEGRIDDARRLGEGLEQAVSRPTLDMLTGPGPAFSYSSRPVLPDDPLPWMAHMWRWFCAEGISQERIVEALVWLAASRPDGAGVTVLDLALAAIAHLDRLGHHAEAKHLARWLEGDPSLLAPAPQLWDPHFVSIAAGQAYQLEDLELWSELQVDPMTHRPGPLAGPDDVVPGASRGYASIDPSGDPLLAAVSQSIRDVARRVSFSQLVALAHASWTVAVAYADWETTSPGFLEQ